MQTFLIPLGELDNKRLGKQRVEAKQIHMALTGESRAWRNHPATIMWEGHESALATYGRKVCETWIDRGYDDSLTEWFADRERATENHAPPWWMTDSKVRHALLLSHTSNLLRKDFDYYRALGANFAAPGETLTTQLPYLWPRRDGSLYLSVAESKRITKETRQAIEEFGWNYDANTRVVLV